MSGRIVIIISFSFSVCTAQVKIPNGKLVNKHYEDTIKFQTAFDLKVVTASVNGEVKRLIFDTGADIMLLNADTSKKTNVIAAKIFDSNGKSSKSYIQTIDRFEILNLKYKSLGGMRLDLPKPLLCMADGVLGNNVIRKSNWMISENYLVASSRSFKTNEMPYVPCFYHAANSLYTKLVIEGTMFDTCLVDYGGRFELKLPMKFYEGFKGQVKKINSLIKRISAKWGVNGISEADTIITINFTANINGIIVENVNADFSYKNKIPEIGSLYLNKFKAVYLDNDHQKIFFEAPVKSKKENELPVSVVLKDSYYVVTGKIMEDKTTSQINIGDRFKSINNKNAGDFISYCDFMSWFYELRNLNTLTIIKEDGSEINISLK